VNAVATIVAKSHLPHARVLADSFHAHQPDVPVFALLADAPHDAPEPFELVELDALGDLDGMRFAYEKQELTYAATPYLIEHLLDRGFDRVVFLKQESLVLASLAPVFEALERDAAVLTPHLLEPAGADHELMILLAGVYNGGLVGVADRPAGRGLLAYWQDRVRRHCLLDPANGLHYEQRWLDLVPTLFEGVRVLRDPTINVGHWNLHERDVSVDVDGTVRVGGAPCRLFRFSGFDPDAGDALTRWIPGRTLADAGAAAPVFERFRAALLGAGWEEASRLPYAYDRFSNGVPIPALARELYRALGDDAAAFGDPFDATSPDGFYAWLNAPVDGGSVTRLWHAIFERRADVRDAYPDVLGADSQSFLAWTASSGLREHGIPSDFLVAA
jgi:hypothetical protein